MPQPRTTRKAATSNTTASYAVTGVMLLVVGYVLFILATDSGSLLLYAGFLVGTIWGVIRLIQAVRRYLAAKKK